MAPGWLTVMACVYLSVCFCCASIISYDIVVNHRRQPMGVISSTVARSLPRARLSRYRSMP